jgi:hypothetical protein
MSKMNAPYETVNRSRNPDESSHGISKGGIIQLWMLSYRLTFLERFFGVGMARSGRFGKYGDLKRKEQIRETRVSRSGQGKALLASAKAAQEDRHGKHRKK